MGNLKSTPSTTSTKYDVFLNFRGEDTRNCFTGHLYEALRRKQIVTFIDDRLKRGDEISPALFGVIEESKISVVIFSKDYASSKWCLNELVKIMNRKNKSNQIVVPVFYGIDPSDVRNQTRSFKDSFDKHGKESQEDVQKWREALTEASNLSGWASSVTRPDNTLVNKIAEDISEKLMNFYNPDPSAFGGLIGLKRIDEVISLLCLYDRENVRTIGIWGMGGIGKTTIADAIFNKCSNQFDGCCFIQNVRERLENCGGLACLQKDILSKVLNDEDLKLDSPTIRPEIKERLSQLRVFIVLDDVDDFLQLETLARGVDGLRQGSRIIITSRDKHVFQNCCVNDDNIYEVEGFNFHEARQLFCNYAFKQKHPIEDFVVLSNELVNYAKGNPLALKVLGLSLNQKNKQEWESAVDKLQTNFNRKIFDVLKISYDGLNDVEKDIFLDIACFLKGKGQDYVAKILDDCEYSLRVLIGKSLITISPYFTIQMHDLLQEMGREIVRKESPNKPGNRSRLWRHEDVRDTLKHDDGTYAVQGMVLDLLKIKDIHLSPQAFKKMYNLRFLKFYDSIFFGDCSTYKLKEQFGKCVYSRARPYNSKVHFPFGLSDLSDKLRSLIWFGYPLTALPSDFKPENLVELDMRGSNLEGLWEDTMHAPKLKWLILGGCTRLTNIPDLSDSPLLRVINLKDCRSLLDFPLLAQHLKYLHYLDLKGCKSLRSFPSNIHFESRTSLDLHDCNNITKFPEISGNITHLNLSGTAIEEVPPSIQSLTKLHMLNLSQCTRLKHICKLESPKLEWLILNGCTRLTKILDLSDSPLLRKIDLKDCRSLLDFPPLAQHLKYLHYLDLRGCKSLRSFPSNIHFESLTSLDLHDCNNITKFPEISGNITHLDLSGTAIEEVPSSIQSLTKLLRLNLSRCTRLKHICKLESLVELNLENCFRLKICPEILDTMRCLEILNLSGTAIKDLPNSIAHLNELRELYLRECKNLEMLPSGICDLISLGYLDLTDCSKLEILPENLGNLCLRDLLLDRISISQLPSTMMQLYELVKLSCRGCRGLRFSRLSGLPCSLKYLYLSDCNLKEIPEDIGSLSSLLHLHLSGNDFESLPKSMKQLSELEFLDLDNCNMLRSLTDLPLGLEQLHASDCKQLRSIPDASEFAKLAYSHFIFTNCPNLEETAVGSMLTLLLTKCHISLSTLNKGCAAYSFCYLGSQVPKWFMYGTEGYSIEFRLNFNCQLVGFAVCVVLAFEEYRFNGDREDQLSLNVDFEEYLLVYYDCRLSDETVICEGNIRVASRNRTLIINSDHVAFGICKASVPRILESEFTNCSFEFSLLDESPNWRVKYCAIHPIYGDSIGEPIKKFGVTIQDIGEKSGRRTRASNDHQEEELEPHSKRLNLDLSL